MQDNVIEFIRESENQFQNLNNSNSQKLELLNGIIQQKVSYSTTLFYSELYQDVKQLFDLYLKAIDEKKHIYDYLNKGYLCNILNNFDELEKISLLNFLIRKLKTYGFEEDISFFVKEKKASEIKLSLRSLPKSTVQLLKNCLLFNYLTIFAAILIAFILFSVILLPSSTEANHLFDVKYKSISKNFVINHWLNALLAILGLNGDDFVSPVNSTGALILVIGRVLFIIFILNIFVTKLFDYFNSKF